MGVPILDLALMDFLLGDPKKGPSSLRKLQMLLGSLVSMVSMQDVLTDLDAFGFPREYAVRG